MTLFRGEEVEAQTHLQVVLQTHQTVTNVPQFQHSITPKGN